MTENIHISKQVNPPRECRAYPKLKNDSLVGISSEVGNIQLPVCANLT
jgi:hypothetical protein